MSDELKTPLIVAPLVGDDHLSVIKDSSNQVVTSLVETRYAAAIVHRVNCHDKLVEALEGMIEVFVDTGTADEDMATVKTARAALELAKGGNVE